MSKSPLTDKNILITGGTGSFGQAFAREVLAYHDCAKVIIFSRDEWKQWQMRQEDPLFTSEKIRYFLGDVRDRERLRRAFDGVDIVIHAAALKQVPAAEYNPTEFVKTNVDGASNVIEAALDTAVDKVIALSTDKAVNPINLYGASKLVSDKLFVAGNVYRGAKQNPKFSVVRYGNVLGSRGSIVPIWQNMYARGCEEILLTDARMTRFWLTLEQGVRFVIASLEGMCGGEIFIPKVPSMKLTDLAEAIAPGVRLKHVGVREGEKLHELLICAEDAHRTYEFFDRFVIAPEILREKGISPAEEVLQEKGKRLKDGFVYASNTNPQWLGVEELRELLHEKNRCFGAKS
ncbi:MAG: UDP-N-acetylglucosamine 4,6-dehydratase (inverting) [Verrucomicrobia bacterium]|nr:UDP-N-acetylglucosamine 4,6-dehydratase (inverting) [Verrucomicrobiota bacterium]